MKPSHLILILTLLLPLSGAGQPAPTPNVDLRLIDPTGELPEVLDSQQFSQLLAAVDRGLAALQQQQQPDGRFLTINYGQPAVTALAVMAYISRGHMPGQGPYGELLNEAINYVLSQQKTSGIFSHMGIDPTRIRVIPSTANGEFKEMTAQTYSHAICMLMLGEIYGLTANKESFRIRNAIENGLKFSIQLWDIRPHSARDDGGFRYTRSGTDGAEGDVSITGWHTASLRSIRNAGFDVPQAVMDRIAAYIIRNQNQDGGFAYIANHNTTYPMTAAGTLCLALAGKHGSTETLRAATYLSHFRASDPSAFGEVSGRKWPYYCCYYQTQASIQLGGQLWVTCMGEVSKYLLSKQSASGLWPPDGSDDEFGPSYSTSMAVIALTPILQILPIYQR